ncbi:MAG: hypothetical protein V4498_07135 [candidate division FCPU426 bacterium]
MLKKIMMAMALVFLAAPPGRAALDAWMEPTAADYQALQDLRSRFGGNGLPEQGANQGELMLALAELGGDAASESPKGDWKLEDYDALYSLLQKYRDELRAMGFSQKQLEDELVALKLRARELQERLDKLQPKDGLKIHGSVENVFDSMLLTGPLMSGGNTLHYMHGILRSQLQLSAQRGIFSGEVEYFVQRVLADMYSCSTCIAAVNSINIEVRTPIVFQAGDLDAKMTPFTLWRNEDEQPFEPEPFRSRRQELRDQLRLKPDAIRMRGVRLITDLVVMDTQRLDLEGVLFNFGVPGEAVYVRGNTAALGNDDPNGQAFSSAYETFFGAWRLSLPLGNFKAGYVGTMVRDAMDTTYVTYTAGTLAGQRVRGFDAQVNSLEASYKKGPMGLEGRVELAQSLYANPNLAFDGNTDYLTGTAASLSVGIKGDAFGLSLSARDVSAGFFSTPAQGRTQDAEYLPLGPFLTENSLYRPNTTAIGPQYGGIGVPEPPESHFNANIVPPQVKQGGTYSVFQVPYDLRMNAISPYGLATPNRQGARLDANFTLLRESWKLMAMADMANEKSPSHGSALLHYTAWRAGTVFDLEPLIAWPLSFNLGFSAGDMRDGDKVAFSSALLDLGADWKAMKNLVLSVGGRHLDYNGTIPYLGSADPTLFAFGYMAVNQAYDIGGIGIKWMLGDDVNVRINYSSIFFEDSLHLTNGIPDWYAADQGFFQLSFVF